jgi:hypothetical protein
MQEVSFRMKITEFFPNEPDDVHCLQCCVRMILTAETGQSMLLAKAEAMTGFEAGKATWQYDTLLEFSKLGYEVMNIESLDQERLSRDPKAAVTAEFGEELWQFMERTSNIERARQSLIQCLKSPLITLEQNVPTLDRLADLIDQGWWLIANVNAKQLDGNEGYEGHSILVEEVGENVLVQNPGLPAIQNQIVSQKDFIAAWHYPNERSAAVVAVRKRPS